MTEYMVVCQQIVGNGEIGFETIYGCDRLRFRSRERAKAHFTAEAMARSFEELYREILI